MNAYIFGFLFTFLVSYVFPIFFQLFGINGFKFSGNRVACDARGPRPALSCGLREPARAGPAPVPARLGARRHSQEAGAAGAGAEAGGFHKVLAGY